MVLVSNHQGMGDILLAFHLNVHFKWIAKAILFKVPGLGWSMHHAGYIALRRIAEYFEVVYDPEPKPGDPISIAQSEFDEAYDALAAAGLSLNSDRVQAWRDFAGWRVNYDAVLLALAELTIAPYAPWSSDRGFRPRRIHG